MKIEKLIFLISILVFLSSCSSLETTDIDNEIYPTDSAISNPIKMPSQFGWNDANCAHILADGHCAHPTSVNVFDSLNNNMQPPVPDATEFNSSNCAHILADGTCAHPL